ncbi:MAG: endolytic transglycosylase MltG [Lachnospiraceae bacterium]|nr:endolytic transglycosylase MltG [Lachnospiraceae bacterium]
MKLTQILATILSAIIKIAVAIWIVNFLYTKTLAAYDFGYRIFTEAPIAPSPGRDVVVSYTEGKSFKDLAKTLEEKGLVRDYKLAMIQMYVSVYKDTIRPGSYTLNTSMTTEEMMKAMSPSKNGSEDDEDKEE